MSDLESITTIMNAMDNGAFRTDPADIESDNARLYNKLESAINYDIEIELDEWETEVLRMVINELEPGMDKISAKQFFQSVKNPGMDAMRWFGHV